MITEEFKRVMFVHKGIVILALMCIATIITYLNSNRYYIGSEQYSILADCYSLYEGELTEAKLGQIYNEYENRIGAYGMEPYAYRSLYEEGLNAMKEMEKPFLVYGNGWNSLLSDLKDDYSLLITLLIFAIIVFAYDSGHKVQNIFNTSVNGRRRLVLVRMLIYTIISAIIIFVHGVIEFILAKNLIGISCYDAPVQSLNDFRACSLNVSLAGGYIIVLLLKFVGAIIGGLCICVTASLLKNIYLAIVSGVLVFFEAYFFSGLYECTYLIPQHLFMSYYTLTEGNISRVLLVSMGIIMLLSAVIIAVNNEHGRRRLV